MSMDMNEIHAIFFEESFEGVDTMEAGLLKLDAQSTDSELINTIFRAAHSIKGGAATFGFSAVSDFTHGVETLLDQLRSGQRQVSDELVGVLLASVDVIRDMLDAFQQGRNPDTDAIARCQADIDQQLSGERASAAPASSAAATESLAGEWQIRFVPQADIFKTGNEPSRIFRELSQLGELTVNTALQQSIDFDDIDPEDCYCQWQLTLRGDVARDEIEACFDWVRDQCELEITAPTLNAEAATAEENAGSVAPAPLPAAVSNDEPAARPAAAAKDSGSIRVSIDKIDALLNLVGELVITQSMLARFGDREQTGSTQGLRDGLMVLERHTRELQESAMQIRMLPIGASFNRFKRLVRDISAKLGKKVELKLSGEETELDKTVLEKMSDPLVHLVRNSLDHGIEMPEERRAAGKPETGVLHLSAYHEGGSIVIQVEDDGAGLNKERILAKAIERGLVSAHEQLSEEQIHQLIFQPGFSTAAALSDLSGRGVGMDVVRRNITDLGGRIDIRSTQGQGSCLKIRLPLTLAILDGQLVRVGNDVYIFSLRSIVETVLVSPAELNSLAGKGSVYRLRDEYIPTVRLRDYFNLDCEQPSATYLERGGQLMVVVETDGHRVGLFVDELLDQQQVVIKSLEENYLPVSGLAGATILGDGSVALIVDVPSLVQHLENGPETMPDPTATPESNAA